MLTENPSRAAIYADHLAGLSYSKLAVKYGLTSSRIGQIVRSEAAKSEEKVCPTCRRAIPNG